jgi:beta-lactamase class A
LRWFSAFFLLASLVLTAVELAGYSRIRADFPAGLKVAGVPVGGMDRQQAAERLLAAYTIPVELRYGTATILMEPQVVDFQLDLESMLAAADQQRTQQDFWKGFWDFLWQRSSLPAEIPLRSSYSEQRLRAYLSDEIATRYDQPPQAAAPVVGTTTFRSGMPGTELDIDASVLLIENSLHSLTERQVSLPVKTTTPSRPVFQNLEVLLKQTIDLSGFDGIAGIYLLDLQNAQEIHFAYRQGQDLPVEPDVAFTASSIIKIPIMVSVFHRLGDPPDPEALRLLGEVIDKSGNESADWLMDRVIDPVRGPLIVTDDMEKLGLKNTFLGGYLTLGSPLLERYISPANSRADVNTDPDPYSQTTPSDIAMLLEDIYQCATTGGGALTAAFPSEITRSECQSMVDYLSRNKIGVLEEAGVPEGTQIAHKHGWVSNNGIINSIGDAGIIYTPGGNFILSIFLNHPDQLIWEPASRLVAELTQAVYNYYNIPK